MCKDSNLYDITPDLDEYKIQFKLLQKELISNLYFIS